MVDMAVSAALRGLGVGLLPVAVFLLLGRHRRGELFRGAAHPAGPARRSSCCWSLPVLVWQPWESPRRPRRSRASWQTLADFVGPDVVLPERGPRHRDPHRSGHHPEQAAGAQRDRHLRQEQGVLLRRPPRAPPTSTCREPEEGETVALLVSDRHDNIGMDRVARAIGEAAGATVVLDAGDDTSTGQPWEAFSLDSLAGAFDDWDRFGVAGNHDHGTFVSTYLADLGWTMLDGEVVDAPVGRHPARRRRPAHQRAGQLARRDRAQLRRGRRPPGRRRLRRREDGERVSTVLVHDANLGREALARGCVDLVVGGHTHVQAGPDAGRGRGRRHRLHLDQRHDRRGGVRHRARQQAAPRRRRQPDHLRRRPPGRPAVGAAAHRRVVAGRGVGADRAPGPVITPGP